MAEAYVGGVGNTSVVFQSPGRHKQAGPPFLYKKKKLPSATWPRQLPPGLDLREARNRRGVLKTGISQDMPSEIGIQRLLAVVLVLGSAMPASSWNLPSATRTFGRVSRGSTRGEQTSTCHPTTHPAYPILGASTAMRAASSPSPSDESSPSPDAARPASLTRVDWLRVGASLAVIAPVIGIADGSSDAASAATGGGSVTVLGAGGKTGRECVEYLASRGTGRVAVPVWCCCCLQQVVVMRFGLADMPTFRRTCRYDT